MQPIRLKDTDHVTGIIIDSRRYLMKQCKSLIFHVYIERSKFNQSA